MANNLTAANFIPGLGHFFSQSFFLTNQLGYWGRRKREVRLPTPVNSSPSAVQFTFTALCFKSAVHSNIFIIIQYSLSFIHPSSNLLLNPSSSTSGWLADIVTVLVWISPAKLTKTVRQKKRNIHFGSASLGTEKSSPAFSIQTYTAWCLNPIFNSWKMANK